MTAGFSSPWLRTTSSDDLLHNMTLGDGAWTTNTSSIAAYAFLSLVLGFAFGLLAVAIDVDTIFIPFVLDCMTSFMNLFLDSIIICVLIIMFYLPFSELNFMKKNAQIVNSRLARGASGLTTRSNYSRNLSGNCIHRKIIASTSKQMSLFPSATHRPSLGAW